MGANLILPAGGAAAAAAAAYTVDYSCRFDGNANLSRAISVAGSLTTFTIAFWVKRGALGTRQTLFSSSNGAGNDFFWSEFHDGSAGTTDTIRWLINDGGGGLDADMYSTRVFRDLSAWYHIAMLVDTTAGTGNRMKLYVNGELETLTGTEISSSYNVEWNNTNYDQYIGDWDGGSIEFDGYLADVHHVDGSAVVPEDNFIEKDSNGQWVPKEYTPSHGTNGFHLPFSNTTGSTVFTDSSSNGYTITASDVVHTATQKKVGDSSMYFNGVYDTSVDYLTIGSSSNLRLDGDEFTIECWVKHSGSGSGWFQAICGNINDGNFNDGLLLGINTNTDGVPSFYRSSHISPLEGTTDITDNNWHHVAVVKNGTAYKIFVDGVEEGSDTGSGTPSNSSNPFQIGRSYYSSFPNNNALQAHIDEFRVSDKDRSGEADFATAVSHSSDADTLLLIHSDWGGDIGGDTSGNSNHFTATSLGSHDQMGDTPSAGKNFCTLNPVASSSTLTEGNLRQTEKSGSTNSNAGSTMMVSSGKWYAEMLASALGSSYFGVARGGYDSLASAGSTHVGSGADSWGVQNHSTSLGHAYFHDGAYPFDGGTPAAGDIYGLALDTTSGSEELKVYQNNTLIKTWDISGSSGDMWQFACSTFGSSGSYWNFGQDATFAGEDTGSGGPYQDSGGEGEFYYAPPAGYLALCTANLPDPGLNNAVDSEKAFAVVTWEGTALAKNIDVGSFTPDLVWAKNREDAYHHGLFDSVRGANKVIKSSADSAEATYSQELTAFISSPVNGFSIGEDDGHYVNVVDDDYVAWCWKAGSTATNEAFNASAGFSIVKYAGTYDPSMFSGDNPQSVSHSLGVAPELMIIKSRDSGSWVVYHKDLDTASGEYLVLDTDAAVETSSSDDPFAMESPTSSVFKVATDSSGAGTVDINTDSTNYIAYLFRSVEGYSKVGKYDGTGSTNFQHTGFRPAILIVKCLDGTNSWIILDSSRDTHNLTWKYLFPDSFDAEPTSGTSNSVDFVSNGFVLRTGDSNTNSSASGYDYIFYAVAENPFKYANAR